MADPHTDFRTRIRRVRHALDPISTGSQQAGDRVVSLAFSRMCRPGTRDRLAWLTGFRAGFDGKPYIWPLGTLNPHVWALGFIEGRGHRSSRP
jgi:hypothetical protein